MLEILFGGKHAGLYSEDHLCAAFGRTGAFGAQYNLFELFGEIMLEILFGGNHAGLYSWSGNVRPSAARAPPAPNITCLNFLGNLPSPHA
jgi:hypothetical protein